MAKKGKKAKGKPEESLAPRLSKDAARKASRSQENLDPEAALANLDRKKSEAAELADKRISMAEMRWASAILRAPSAMISKQAIHAEVIEETKELEAKIAPSAHFALEKKDSKGSKVVIKMSATQMGRGRSIKSEEEDDEDEDDEEDEEQEKREEREKRKKPVKKVPKTRMEKMQEKEAAKEEKTKRDKEAKLQAALAEARGEVSQEEPAEKPKKEKKTPKKAKKEKKEKEDVKKPPVKVDFSKRDDKKVDEIDWKHRYDELKKIAKEIGIEEVKSKTRLIEGPKKKLSKKEKARITAEAAEKIKQEAEANARRLEELIKKKKEEERLAAIEKDKREVFEQGWRMEQLEHTKSLMEEVVGFNKAVLNEETGLLEWEKYVACGKLPNSKMCDQMNTYLHLWQKEMEDTSVEKASERTRDVIQLLSELDELIDTGGGETEKLENWKWVRYLFRNQQTNNLDVATYHLLRDVERNLNRINIPTADFNFKDDYVTLCMWLRVMLPIPLPNPRRPPKPRIDISFNLMDTSVLFPFSIDCENAAIRVMYVKYDHLSDLSDTFSLPEVPKEYYMDLIETSKKEWCRKLKYKYDHRDKTKESVKETAEDPENADAQSVQSEGQKSEQKSLKDGEGDEKSEHKSIKSDVEVTSDTEDIPLVPYKLLKPSASEYAISKEDQLYSETRSLLKLELEDDIINLRKYTILGGVYHLNYLAQPPQPQDFITMDMTVTSLYLPKQLQYIPFSVTYAPPPPEDANVRKVPEEIEEDMKKQEEELDKLICITIKWPQHVIFLELPIVCKWDEEVEQWSKEQIFDLKHNEEKCMLTFRTGVFGTFGLATYRYANLPFQAYDIKPEADDSVTIQLTAAILMLEFNIKNGLISITQLQNSPNVALQDVVGQYFKIHRLIRMMKDAGIDIFPSFDSFCYVEGSCEKQWAMESHLYDNMALMANCFNFAWSRWNLQSGRRKIVMQMRDYVPTKPKQKNHQMLLVTPLKACFIDCNEVSPVFSDKEIESSKITGRLEVQKHFLELVSRLKYQSMAEKLTLLPSKDNKINTKYFCLGEKILQSNKNSKLEVYRANNQIFDPR